MLRIEITIALTPLTFSFLEIAAYLGVSDSDGLLLILQHILCFIFLNT